MFGGRRKKGDATFFFLFFSFLFFVFFVFFVFARTRVRSLVLSNAEQYYKAACLWPLRSQRNWEEKEMGHNTHTQKVPRTSLDSTLFIWAARAERATAERGWRYRQLSRLGQSLSLSLSLSLGRNCRKVARAVLRSKRTKQSSRSRGILLYWRRKGEERKGKEMNGEGRGCGCGCECCGGLYGPPSKPTLRP